MSRHLYFIINNYNIHKNNVYSNSNTHEISLCKRTRQPQSTGSDDIKLNKKQNYKIGKNIEFYEKNIEIYTSYKGVAVAASVFTITAMSIDRYFAIRSPIVFRRVSNRKSIIIVIITLWIIAMTIFAPMLKMVCKQYKNL
uniref:G-protein coupled receptors family 1 profile domain-containing protein n=1 Tax=Trichogramma kaykai TaxID=54128 RepID=A0ABD2WTH6_9HYME